MTSSGVMSPACTTRCVRAEQVVTRIVQCLLELREQVRVERARGLGERPHLRDRQQPVQEVGTLVAQRDDLLDIVVGQPDHTRDERHRQAVADERHPLDAAVVRLRAREAVRPEPVHHRVEAVLERGEVAGSEVGCDELARRAVIGLVARRQHVDGGAERGHVELRR